MTMYAKIKKLENDTYAIDEYPLYYPQVAMAFKENGWIEKFKPGHKPPEKVLVNRTTVEYLDEESGEQRSREELEFEECLYVSVITNDDVMRTAYDFSEKKISKKEPYFDAEKRAVVLEFELVDLTAEDKARNLLNLGNDIRARRNTELSLSDWTQTVDCPLTVEKKAEWATYRQALRDITELDSWPNVVFPTKPE